MKIIKKKAKPRKIAEIWVTEKGNPKLRNFGYVEHDVLMGAMMVLRDVLMAEIVVKKFLDDQKATVLDPKTGMPTTSGREN